MIDNLDQEERFLSHFVVNKITGNKNITDFCENTNLDWDKVYDLSLRHKLHYFIYQEYKNRMPKETTEKFQLLLASKKHLTDLLWAEILMILDRANKLNIDVCLLRGIIFSDLIYSDIYARGGSDIDLLVREEDYAKLEELIQSLGYRKEFYYNEELLKIDRYHQTDVIFGKRRDENIWVELLTESNLIETESPQKWLDDKQHMLIHTQDLLQFPLVYQCLLLFNNVYINSEHIYSNLENRINLRDYLDIGVFCSTYAQQLDWNKLSRLADELGIANQVYCVMMNTNQLIPHFFDAKVAEFFDSKHAHFSEDANNENGSIIDWDISVTQRMFNDTTRKQHCLCTLKKMIDSEKNVNFNQPEEVHPKVDQRNIKWMTFYSASEDLSFLYQFYYGSHNFYIRLHFHEKDMEKYYLHFGFVRNIAQDIAGEFFDPDIIFHTGQDTLLKVNTKEENDSITYISNNEVEIAFPISCFGDSASSYLSKKIYYNIILIKEISKNVFKNVDFKFNCALSNRINYPCIKFST